MLNWLKKTFGKAAPAPQAATARRNFAAAQINRLTASFSSQQLSLNQRLQRGLRVVRARSRDLAANNDHGRQFVRLYRRNVVGSNGFGLQVQALRPDGSLDELDSSACEKAFAAWSKKGMCDVTGRYSFLELQLLIAHHIATDGEVLVRRVRNKSAFRYQLQLIDPALLDDQYNVADAGNGRRIRMGVETDEWGRVLAYHLLQDVEQAYGAKRVRIDANEIWHLFMAEEIGQVRGVPPMAAPMLRMNNLGAYEDAAVIAARVGASKMGFFKSTGDAPPPNLASVATVDGATDTDPGQFIQDAEPGVFDVLPQGYEFQAFDPDYPHANFDSFCKATLRGIAAGLGVSYTSLTGDLSEANYSSARVGLLDEREEWKLIQSWLIESFFAPLYSEWLEMALLSGQLALPMAKYDKFNAATWQGRRWQWIDPHKEINANSDAIAKGLTTPSAVIRESGRDPDDVWREWGKDLRRIQDQLSGLDPLVLQIIAGAAKAAPSVLEDANGNAGSKQQNQA